MATLDRTEIIKDLQIAEIEDILKADLSFLAKLSSQELRALAIALKEFLVGQEDCIYLKSDSVH